MRADRFHGLRAVIGLCIHPLLKVERSIPVLLPDIVGPELVAPANAGLYISTVGAAGEGGWSGGCVCRFEKRPTAGSLPARCLDSRMSSRGRPDSASR